MTTITTTTTPFVRLGWTVTVAGTYDDMAPDVQMRLSFPKRPIGASQCSRSDKLSQCQQIAFANEELNEFEALDNYRNDSIESSIKANMLTELASTPSHRPLEPLQGHSMKFNPKRSLTKNYYGPGICAVLSFPLNVARPNWAVCFHIDHFVAKID